MCDEARALHREDEVNRRRLRPAREILRPLQPVEGAVDLECVELLRGIGEFALLRQSLRIKVSAPGRIGPAGNPDPHRAAPLRHDRFPIAADIEASTDPDGALFLPVRSGQSAEYPAPQDGSTSTLPSRSPRGEGGNGRQRVWPGVEAGPAVPRGPAVTCLYDPHPNPPRKGEGVRAVTLTAGVRGYGLRHCDRPHPPVIAGLDPAIQSFP